MKEYPYKFTLNNTNEEINFKYWTLREEKDLFLEANNPNLTKIETSKIFLEFFKSHIKEKDLFNNFSKVDIFQLMIELRSYSKGNNIQYEWKCTNDKCSAKDELQNNTFDITKDFIFPKDNLKTLTIKDYTFNFKRLNIFKELDIIETNISTPNQTKFDILLSSIDSILLNNKLLTFSGLEDIKNYILDCPPFVGIDLSKKYSEIVPEIKIIKTNNCVSCKNKYPLSVGELNFFFTFLLLA